MLHSTLCLLLSNAVYVITSKDVSVRTELGEYRGKQHLVLNRTLNVFLGIPYAKPPIGKLRFRHPEPVEPHREPYHAVRLPNACPHIVDTRFGEFKGVTMWAPNTNMSEDCLYLNIWAPAPTGRERKRAVMIWIHGGGFFAGTGSSPLYDGRALSSYGDVIVVTMHYRLSLLGFLYLDTPEVPGNQGFADQLMANKWVHKHIHHFGGDPQRITLFGNSAGASAVGLHVISPSNAYFQNAIIQSSPSLQNWAVMTAEFWFNSSVFSAQDGTGCRGTTTELHECLMNMTALNFQKEMFGQLIADGRLVPEAPSHLVKKLSKKVNVMIGLNSDEGSKFVIDSTHPMFVDHLVKSIDKRQYYRMVGYTLPFLIRVHQAASTSYSLNLPVSTARCIHALYDPPDTTADTSHVYLQALAEMQGDLIFKCASVQLSDALHQRGLNVYQYLYGHRSSTSPWPEWMGVVHADEIEHVFGHPLLGRFTAEERDFSRVVLRYWTNFAKTGNPNDDGDEPPRAEYDVLPTWPQYDMKSKPYVVLNTSNIRVEHGYRKRQCHFWETQLPRLLKNETQDCNLESGSRTLSCHLREVLLTFFVLYLVIN